jgi:glycosyltransferase involved in cell wall biosynthesis
MDARTAGTGRRPILLFVVNETYFFVSHRLPVAEAARAAGYEVHVAAPDDHVWAPEDFSIQRLIDAGFVYHRIPLSRRGTNPLQELRTLVAIFALLRRLRPTLVHLLTVKPTLYGGLSARLLGIPAVATVTGLGHAFSGTGWRLRLLRRLLLTVYRLSLGHRRARVIFQNPDDRATLVDGGVVVASQAALVRGSGVDLTQFRPRPEPADGPPLAVMAARLIWEKGVDDFAAAARLLRHRGTAVRCVLVGRTHPDNPRAVPESMLRSWQTEGVLEWWGRREDMAAVYAQAAMVVLPSRYGEGIPKVLIEAAAAGRAIIATDIPGCRDIARNTENGVLVPPGDPAALAAAIAQLAGDPELRRRLGTTGRAIALDGFSDREVAQRTVEVYRELTSQGRCGAPILDKRRRGRIVSG